MGIRHSKVVVLYQQWGKRVGSTGPIIASYAPACIFGDNPVKFVPSHVAHFSAIVDFQELPQYDICNLI